MRRVLILCTGNSCRSQMAEALWNALGAGRWHAVSAGSQPSGYVHPMAIQVISEKQHQGRPLDISGCRSKHADEFANEAFDLVVTVCDNAKSHCPVPSKAISQLHWPFDDPAAATGSDADKLIVFRRVRDEIAQRIAEFLSTS